MKIYIINLASAIKRKEFQKTIGRGYRTFDNFRSAILFFYGGLDIYPLKSR
jgi:hypothetical protein